MTRIADELMANEDYGFENIDKRIAKPKKARKNKAANGIDKYLKTYLAMYDWRDREKLIVQYTENKINPKTGNIINKMKQRVAYIQDNFDDFVTFLKQTVKKK